MGENSTNKLKKETYETIDAKFNNTTSVNDFLNYILNKQLTIRFMELETANSEIKNDYFSDQDAGYQLMKIYSNEGELYKQIAFDNVQRGNKSTEYANYILLRNHSQTLGLKIETGKYYTSEYHGIDE
jgi:hypothetical protein